MISSQLLNVVDPVKFGRLGWPHVNFYDKQREILYSLLDDSETVVPAANMMGKDFVSAFAVLWFFCTRRPCRVLTSSAKDDHLIVLWGEMNNFIRTCKFPLLRSQGGPLIVKHREILWAPDGEVCPLSYIKGMVANDQSMASMGGHHVADRGDGIPRTLWVNDESSSMKDEYKGMVDPWANRKLIIGNTYPCNNPFYKAIEGDRENSIPGGDIPRPNGKGYYRRVIRIEATDSPNVKYAQAEIEAGREPSGRVIVPGVMPWEKYQEFREVWSDAKKEMSLRARFWKGANVLLYPSAWLDRAERKHLELVKSGRRRIAKAIGCDPAEGGDSSAWSVVDELGVIELFTIKTPDTSVIPKETVRLMKKYNIPAEKVCFDRGGGGKQAADTLRDQGYEVKTVAFGEAASPELRRIKYDFEEKVEGREEQKTFRNRRAQIFWRLRVLIDPGYGGPIDSISQTFAIPAQCFQYREQMGVIPLTYGKDGEMYVLSKNKTGKNSREPTLVELIGHSPDELDSLAVAVYAMEAEEEFVAGRW